MATSGLGEAGSGNGAASDTTKSKLQDGKSPLASRVGGCVKDGFHGHSETYRAARGTRLVLCGDLWKEMQKEGLLGTCRAASVCYAAQANTTL